MKLLEELLILAGKLTFGIFRLVVEIIELLLDALLEKKGGYDAKFISQSRLLSRNATGFCLTGKHSLSIQDSCRNALILGQTGTGKSSACLYPSVYRMTGHSLIIHDPSQEIYLGTAGYLKSQGYRVKLLNFGDVSSVKYNPLRRIKTNADIHKVASMIIRNTLGSSRGDPFWNLQGTGVLAVLINILLQQQKRYQNMANLKYLVNQFSSDPGSLDPLFIRTNDQSLFDEYQATISMEPKVLANVLATCKASLTNLSDETLLKVTSKDELDFSRFRREKLALYICHNIHDSSYYATATSILLEQILQELLEQLPKPNSRCVFFLIDEAATLFMPGLSAAVSNCRKFFVGIMLLCQSYNQLLEKYGNQGEAENIKSNCFAQLYFPGQNLQTTRELEQILGKFEEENDKGNSIVRNLMNADQIRTMDNNSALLICSNYRPVKLRLTPYYKQRKFRRYANLPPPSPQVTSGDLDEIPIIPLKRSSDG